MAKQMFCSMLNTACLQQHLLAVPTPTLTHIVQASIEFFRIYTGKRQKPPLRFVEEKSTATVAVVQDKFVRYLLLLVQQLAKQVCQLKLE